MHRQVNRRSPDRREQEFIPFPNDVKEKIIRDGDGTLINSWGEKLGKQYKDISTSRIRKFFGGIELMIEFDINSLQLLRPQLAYVVGKESNKKVKPVLKDFRDQVDSCIGLVKDQQEFENLKKFLESIIAYHRYYGGRE